MATAPSNPDAILSNTQLDEYYEDIKSANITRSIGLLAQNPYPGLRPFRTSESAVFFGRQEICLELINRLSQYNFLAVIGASGTGKSSLIRAGLLPKLQSLPGKFGEWRVAILRPGQDPFANLGRAISEAKIIEMNSATEIIDRLKESSFGFEQLYKDASQSGNQTMPFNTLIVVDQFEEIFRYRRDNGIAGLNDAALFVKMLISISENKELNTYVLLTMRTEYLNDCVQIAGLAEKINKGQFLVPALNIDQLKETIMLPLMLTGAKAEEGIENKIIGELGEIGDQLPVLQHTLRVTFEQGKKNLANNGGRQLNYADYKTIGKIQNALNQHADRLYEQLNDSGKHYCKLLFQCLTERTNDGRLIRRPKPFGTILDICVKDEKTNKDRLRDDLTNVINRFRTDDVSFLMPPYHVPLSDDIEIDISHESLMRNWARLKKWIDEEVYYGNLYRYLNENREASEKKPGSNDWITGGKLDDLVEWRDHYTNNPTWAARYTIANDGSAGERAADAYLNNLAFLKASQQRDEERIQHDLDIKNELEIERLRAVDLQNSLEKERLQTEDALIKGRRRRSILILIFILLTGTAFGFILVHKNSQIKSKQHQVDKDSVEQAKLLIQAKKTENAAKVSDSLAKTARGVAAYDSLNAAAFYKIAKEKQADLERARVKFNREKKELIDKQAIAISASQRRSDSLQKAVYVEVIKHDFQNSKFSSIAVDSAILKDAANYSLELINGKKQVEYKIFLAEMDSVFNLNSQMDNDPVNGIKGIRKKWSKTSNPVLQKLILDVINKHIYYKQKLFTSNGSSGSGSENLLINSVQYDRNFAYLFIPNDRVALKKDASRGMYHVELQTGKLDHDSLILNNSLNPDIFASVNFLQYTGAGVFGANNKALYHWANNGTFMQNNLSNKAFENILAVSSDGQYILSRSSKTADCRLWKTADYIASKRRAAPPVQIKNTTNILSAQFSPNDKYLLLKTLNGTLIYNFPNGLSAPKFTITNGILSNTYAIPKFTADEEKLLWFLKYSNKIYLTELNGAAKDTVMLKYPNNKMASLQNVSLSNDYKTLLVEDYYHGISVLKGANGDPAFSALGKHLKTNLTYIAIPDIYSKAAFLDNSSFMAYDRSSNIFLWKLYPNFKDVGEALSSIQTLESVTDKLSSDRMSFKQALSLTDKNELLEAASYYFPDKYYPGRDTNRLNHAKDIYYKLLNMNGNNSYEAMDYAQNIVIINDNLYELNTDTLFAGNVKSLNENIAIEEKYFAKSLDTRKLSTYYGNLSWNSFFVKDFQKALDAAKKGSDIDKTNGFIITNLALGYLFTKDFKSAEKVYSDYKDKLYDINVLYKDSFKEDIQNLKKHHIIITDPANITDPADKEIYGEVQHILNTILL